MKRDLFDKGRLEITLLRLAHEVLEKHPDLQNTCLIGLQPRGVYFSRRMQNILSTISGHAQIEYGEMDATFFRDDFRRGKPLLPNPTNLNFTLEDKHVILIDDVLFTGRTVRAALDAMLAFGRPKSVELMVLIDRKRMRELPIESFYIGIGVDTLNHEKVYVQWEEVHGIDAVRIESLQH